MLLFLLLALLIIGAGYVLNERSESDATVVSPSIQETLPTLIKDDSIVVYVVDDSGSLNPYLDDLRRALQEVSQKAVNNSEIAMLIHGDYPTQLLFDFTDPVDAPLESAIASLTASSDTEWMYQALDEAYQMLLDKPDCQDKPPPDTSSTSKCFEKFIVMVGDGETFDPERSEAVISKIEQSNIAVNAIYIGAGNEAAMQSIASRTGGSFIRIR